MNIFKKANIILLFLSLILVIQNISNYEACQSVKSAADIKINKTKLTLIAGQSSTLKITGTNKKITWSTDKKNIATVSKTGKVYAKKAGTAKIVATVGSKKYTCTVTIKPYKTKKITISNVSFLIPSSYTKGNSSSSDSNYYYPITTTPAEDSTGVIISILKTGTPPATYKNLKNKYSKLIKSEFSSTNIKNTNYTTRKYSCSQGTAFVASFNIVVENISVKHTYYILSIDNYLIQVLGLDQENTPSNPKINTVAKYIIDTISIKK